ncbi:MAG: hypothetical protein ISR00_03620 [Flavobacteriales bacterium]|nr:hypothetical protein [Flavobacteriales bacterium]MBL6873022.1 hypothetical protein [Flavobacteriales bacterium]
MKVIKYFYIFFLLISCSNQSQISLTKLEKSDRLEEAKLNLIELTKKEDNNYSFNFDIQNFGLGIQTDNENAFKLANSKKGQHIHLILNNDPYFAKYSASFEHKLDSNNNVILAFLSRSYHESVKNENAFILTQTGDQYDLNNEFLFYSRPKGIYKLEDSKEILLDFYLVNTSISKNGNKVRATIQNQEFILYEWRPYLINGLEKGEISVKLELLDANGEIIKTPFNPSSRSFIIE